MFKAKLLAMLNKCFPLEEINGGGVCPTYLYRWTLLGKQSIKVYLHYFVADDWSLDLHDHPKRFITIGLKGRYLEETAQPAVNDFRTFREYRAPWFRSFEAEHAHRLRLVDRQPCWTLAIVFKTVRKWGFWRGSQWVPWREYVDSPDADKFKSCAE